MTLAMLHLLSEGISSVSIWTLLVFLLVFLFVADYMKNQRGKRACLGEQLARAELFLFFMALLQKFTFRMPQDTVPSFRYRMPIIRQPQPYHICALPR